MLKLLGALFGFVGGLVILGLTTGFIFWSGTRWHRWSVKWEEFKRKLKQ